MNFLRESIDQGTQWVVFEPNAPDLWARIRRNVSAFLDLPSLLIVIAGTALATLIKFPLGHFLSAVKVAMNAFFNRSDDPLDLIAESVEMANVARKQGLLALEGMDIKNEFLARGIQMLTVGCRHLECPCASRSRSLAIWNCRRVEPGR